MDDGRFVLVRLKAGSCTNADLRRYFSVEHIAVTDISTVDADFIVTSDSKEDHQKLIERGHAKIDFEGREFELSFESVDGCILERLKSQEDKSSENSGESGSFVVVGDESEEDILSTSSEGAQLAGFGNVLSPMAQELIKKAVKVSNVGKSNFQDLRNFVTLEREGGGDLEADCYSEAEGIAYFVFEKPEVAANLLRRRRCEIMNSMFEFEPPQIREYLSINDSRVVDSWRDSDRTLSEVNPGESKFDETVERETEGSMPKKIRLAGEDLDSETVEEKSQVDGHSSDAETRDGSPPRHPNCTRKSKSQKKRMKRKAHKDKIKMRFDDKDVHEIGRKVDITSNRRSGDSGNHDDGNEEESKNDVSTHLQNKNSYVERGEAMESTYEAIWMLPKAENDFSMIESLDRKNDGNETFEDQNEAFEERNSVVVYGIPDEQFFLDSLLYVLEHKRKGGGEVREFKYEVQGTFGKVIVTFKDERVARNFVKRRTLKVQEQRVFFLSMDEELKLKRTILIPNVPKDDTKDMICFVESPKKGGGTVEFEKYQEENEDLWITFASGSVADRMKESGSLTALGRTFSILEAPFFGLVDVDVGKRTVFVGNLTDEIRHDLLMFLENNKLGGCILNHKLHRLERCLEISFFNESVSQKLLELKSIPLMGKTYPVASSLEELRDGIRRPSDAKVTSTDKPNDGDKPRGGSSPSKEDVGKASEIPTRSATQTSGASSGCPESRGESCLTENMTRVVVKNIPSNVDDKILQLYGESKRLRGGPCKVVYFNEEMKEAAIEFKNPKDALSFIESDKDQITKQSNKKNNMTFHLLEFNPSGFESHAVLVKDFEGLNKDVLLFYLESKSSSRGGPVVECDFRDKNTIYVVFQNAEDARSAVDKGDHVLNNTKFTVLEFPAQPPPLYIREKMVDKKRLLVRNYRWTIGETYLKEIMEKIGNAKVDELVKGKKLIMLVFQSQPDYFSLRKHTSCFPIKGYMLALSRVAYTNQIQLALPLNFDLGLVKVHLDALIRDKDEPKFESIKKNGLVVVTFKRHETVQELPLSNLKIADLKIDAKPYFSELQVDSVKPVVPSEVKVFYDVEVLEYVAGRPSVREEIEASLRNVLPLTIVWPSSESEIILRLASNDSNVAYDWYKLAEGKLKEQLKLYHWKEKSCLKDLWKEASEQMKRCQEMPKNATMKFDDEKCVVRFNAGPSERRKVEKLIVGIIDAIHSKRRKVVEEEEFQANRISLLGKMFDSLDMPKDVKVTTSANKLTYEGPSESVANLKLEVLRATNDFVTEEFESRPNVCNFLKRADVLKRFDDDMKKEKLLADISCSGDRIEVIGTSEESLIKAKQLINSCIKEGQMKLKQDQTSVIGLEVWTDFVSGLKAKLTYFELDVQNDDFIHYICLETVEEKLLDSVNKFLSENSTGEVFLKSQEGFLSAITKFFADDLKELNDNLIKQGGCVIARSDGKEQIGFELVGKKSELESNKRKLSLMLNKIKMEKVNLRNPDIMGHFQSPPTRDLIKNLETNHSVVIRTYNEDVDSSQSVEKLLRFSFLKKPEIFITTNEVDDVGVDAIIHVFFTSSDLESQKIFQLGGEEMVSVAKEWFSAETKEEVLVSTSVGKLPCKKVYHVLVPNCAHSMPDAVQFALKDANESGFLSASFLCPDVEDSNRYSYLAILIQTLVEFGQYSGTLESFTILCENSEALEFCRAILSDLEKKSTKEEAVAGVDPEEEEYGELEDEFEFRDVEFDDGARRTNLSSEIVSKLEVIIGSIGEVRADVIVNSASKDLDLARGQASKCLLSAAGHKIQEECTKKKPKKFEPGDIVSTGGYNLKCSKVYHVHLSIWKGEHSGKTIRTIVKNVLTKASKKNFKTVAFPALGTGNLKAPPEKVASMMFQESATFLESNPNSSIQKIYFVVYDKDFLTVKAFEDHWKSFSEESPDEDVDSSGGSSPVAMAASLSIDASDPQKLKLGSLDVEVVKGDITSFTADAIVNSTNVKMDMSGAVGKAILKKGGADLAEELKTTKMKATGVCVTKAGSLPANFIVHVVAQRENSWDPIIQEALKEADSYGCSSIAFPVLGTGNFSLSAENMATVMISNFHAFGTSAGPKNLKKIYVCVYLDAIMKGFISGIKKMDPSQNKGLLTRALNKVIGIKDALKNLVSSEPQEQPTELPVTSNVDHSAITLAVYGLELEEISRVIESIRSNIGNHFSEKLLNSERDVNLIGKLKCYQIKKINRLKEKYKVDIKVNTKDGSKGIVVSGFTDNSTSAMQAIWKILDEVEKDEEDRVKAEILKEQISWEYKDTDGFFKSFEPLINFQLEKAHTNHKAQFHWKRGNRICSVDFRTMKEISEDGSEKDVRRIKADPDLPKSWSKFSDSQKLMAVVLNPSDQEFLTVRANALNSAQGTLRTISKIERIENPYLYKMYQARKSAVESSLGGKKQAEMILWHGTSSDVVDKINEKGFNRSYCGKNATTYGRGVYFAKNFSYSAHNTYSPPDINGTKHVYQCKVLVGDYTAGSQTIIAPPAKPGTQDSYDSVVDNVQNPSIFVVFYDNQAYPEYLIHFS